MKLATMTTREQVLALVAAAVLLGGAYGVLRYKPALKMMAAVQEQTKETEERLKTESLPTPPDEDEATLQQQMKEAEAKLTLAKSQITGFESDQPAMDNQEITLKLSELAQASRLLVRGNVPYQLNVASKAASGSIAAPKRATRTQRQQARQAAKEVAENAASNNTAALPVTITTAPVTPGYGLDLLERYAQPGYSRPMQQLNLQGYYADIRYFMNELQKLPWPVTVAQLQIETDTTPTEPGAPQALRASMVLAL